MKGYTAKVGLRKPKVRLRIKVRAGSLCASAGLVDTIRQAMETAEALEYPAVVQRYRKGCGSCRVCYPDWRGMYLCATCGNKRCPRATDCRYVCTGSNEPGQKGSVYA